MDANSIVIIIAAAVVVVAVVGWLVLRAERDRAGAEVRAGQLTQAAESLASSQAQLAGRLSQLADSQAASQAQLAERMQAQERAVTKALEERLADVTKRLTDGLEQSSHKQATTMHDLRERLAVIDAAQKNITELSVQMVGLQEILSNKQARGAFGEIQLNDLVSAILPPSAYEFQATLKGGKRVDCLLRLPNPPGAIGIDAKFPLESFHALRNAPDDAGRAAAGRAFGTAVLKHVRDIAEKYIVPGETAESALMFLPSEAIYAELHANFPDVIEKSFRAKVWIVSPTTLMATLNTVRAVLKDARMREQAGVIQKEVELLLEDVGRLDERVDNLGRHFNQAAEDIKQIRTSTDKVTKRAGRIEDIQLGEDGPAEELAPPVKAIEGVG